MLKHAHAAIPEYRIQTYYIKNDINMQQCAKPGSEYASLYAASFLVPQFTIGKTLDYRFIPHFVLRFFTLQLFCIRIKNCRRQNNSPRANITEKEVTKKMSPQNSDVDLNLHA